MGTNCLLPKDAYFTEGLGDWELNRVTYTVDFVTTPTPHSSYPGSQDARITIQTGGTGSGPELYSDRYDHPNVFDTGPGLYGVDPGTVVTFSSWLRADPSNPYPAGMDIYWQVENDAGNIVQSVYSNGGLPTELSSTAWTQLSAQMTVPTISGSHAPYGIHLSLQYWALTGTDPTSPSSWTSTGSLPAASPMIFYMNDNSFDGLYLVLPNVVPTNDNGYCVKTLADIRPEVTTLLTTGPWGSLTGCAVTPDESTLYVCDASSAWKLNLDTLAHTTWATGLSGAGKMGIDSAGTIYIPEESANQITQVTASGVQSVLATCPSPYACDVLDLVTTGEGLLILSRNGNSYQYHSAPGGAASLSGNSEPINGDIWVDTSNGWSIGNNGTSVVGAFIPDGGGGDALQSFIATDGAVVVYAGVTFGDFGGPASTMKDGDQTQATFLRVGDLTMSHRSGANFMFLVGDGPDGRAVRTVGINPFLFIFGWPKAGMVGSKMVLYRGGAIYTWDTAAPNLRRATAKLVDFGPGFWDTSDVAVDPATNTIYVSYNDGGSTTAIAKITSSGTFINPWVTLPDAGQSSNSYFLTFGRDGNIYMAAPTPTDWRVYKITTAGVITEIVALRQTRTSSGARYNYGASLAALSDGTVWVPLDPSVNMMRRYSPTTDTVTNIEIEQHEGTGAYTNFASGIFADNQDNVLIGMGTPSGWMLRVTEDGSSFLIAGNVNDKVLPPTDGCGVSGRGVAAVSDHSQRVVQTGVAVAWASPGGASANGATGGAGSRLYDTENAIALDPDGQSVWWLDDSSSSITGNLLRKLERRGSTVAPVSTDHSNRVARR